MCKSFLLLILLLFSIYYILLLFDPLWYNVLRGRKPDIKLSYEDFMKYYNLAPHRYQLEGVWKHLVKYEDYNFHYTRIGFNIIDTYKVVHILKTVEKHQQQEYENEKMKEYLTYVQKDTDIFKESDE